MVKPQTSPYLVFILLAAAAFLSVTATLMLAPLLVELSREFDTSVAVSGQLAAATFATWGITAFLVGPLSDIYGRRLIGLTGLMLVAAGVLCSALAWNYPSLLALRLVTGIGGAVLPTAALPAIADIFPPEARGRMIGWLATTVFVAPVLGVPVVALLAEAGGWRLPFYTVGALMLPVWGMLWIWFPKSLRSGQPLSFYSHFKEAGRRATFWYVLAANTLSQTAFFGVFTYLAAYLIQTYQIGEGGTAWPLAVAGAGAVVGARAGGSLAGRSRRLAMVSTALVGGGLAAGVVFNVSLPLWAVVVLSFVALGVFSLTLPVFVVVMLELAGDSRGTAMGLFGASRQVGGVVGASVGGLLFSLGSFSLVGVLCLAVAVAAALLVRLKVSTSPELSAQTATPG